jgi:hypothetical protein
MIESVVSVIFLVAVGALGVFVCLVFALRWTYR